ncbi:hypothetical protein [Sorangium sp. So ce124]|uniref:hypothetical protein n=1 Tax=Sorangium sp. So ce124 TaxID=3133280 RepID=UPI003F6357DE
MAEACREELHQLMLERCYRRDRAIESMMLGFVNAAAREALLEDVAENAQCCELRGARFDKVEFEYSGGE